MEKISPSIFAMILTRSFVALPLGLPSSELQTASWHVLCPSETRAALACKQYISSVVKWEDNSLIPRLYSTPYNSLGMRPLLNIYSIGNPVERVLETCSSSTCFMSQKQELGTKQERRTGIGTMDRDRDEGTGTSYAATRLHHHLLCQAANASVGHHL